MRPYDFSYSLASALTARALYFTCYARARTHNQQHTDTLSICTLAVHNVGLADWGRCRERRGVHKVGVYAALEPVYSFSRTRPRALAGTYVQVRTEQEYAGEKFAE